MYVHSDRVLHGLVTQIWHSTGAMCRVDREDIQAAWDVQCDNVYGVVNMVTLIRHEEKQRSRDIRYGIIEHGGQGNEQRGVNEDDPKSGDHIASAACSSLSCASSSSSTATGCAPGASMSS